jgi:Icc-related predicted phosphoesterase/GNAT superfamily N-acetyltransferase
MASVAKKILAYVSGDNNKFEDTPKSLDSLYNLEQNYAWSVDHDTAYAKLHFKFGSNWFQETKGELNVGKAKCQQNYIRFVSISDTHGKHRALSENDMLPEGDVIIHAGDFTNTGSIKQTEDFCAWFSSLPYKYKIVIAGNHDLTLDKEWYQDENNWRQLHIKKRKNCEKAIEIMRSCKNLIYLEDESVEALGYKIYGSPYQPEFCNWAFNLPRGEKCDEKWIKIPTDTDVLITHGPPLGHGDKCMHGGRAGCYDLLRHVQKRIKPLVHVFGHIHESYGTTTNGETTFINASSCNFRYQPLQKPIVFDLPKKSVSNGKAPSIEFSVRAAKPEDFHQILNVINDAAIAYKGFVEQYTEPYMPEGELKNDIDNAGINFFVAENVHNNTILGVMGIQPRQLENSKYPDVTLIRHAYTRTNYQGHGIGRTLLNFLIKQSTTPVLVGTWTKSEWAIRFYIRNNFSLITDENEKNRLLRTYWFCEGLGELNDPASEHRKEQMQASVVLADQKWNELANQ